MILAIYSDLHIETRNYDYSVFKPVEADVAIFAGDICPWTSKDRVDELLDHMAGVAPWVIYVPGNHEYYGTSPEKANELADVSAQRYPNICMMTSPDHFDIEGLHFVCGTMWYKHGDVSKFAEPRSGTFTKNGRRVQFSDFYHISGHGDWVYKENEKFLKALREMRKGSVVVSHHLPSPKSVPVQFQNEVDNAFYVCDVSHQILHQEPSMWIHGHTHTPTSYFLGDTEVLANPRGYPREERSGYSPHFSEVY